MNSLTQTLLALLVLTLGAAGLHAQEVRQAAAPAMGAAPVEVSSSSATTLVQHSSPAIGQPALEVSQPAATGEERRQSAAASLGPVRHIPQNADRPKE